MSKALVVFLQDQNYLERSKVILLEISADFRTSLKIHKLLQTLCSISDFTTNVKMVLSDNDVKLFCSILSNFDPKAVVIVLQVYIA